VPRHRPEGDQLHLRQDQERNVFILPPAPPHSQHVAEEGTAQQQEHALHVPLLPPLFLPLPPSLPPSLFDSNDHHTLPVLSQDPTQDFLVRCSYIEIYNENITDLLNTKNTNLKIHTNPKGGVFVADVTMPVVGTAEVAQTLITKGSASRHVGATNMNSESSRSHSIFRMLIESKDKKNDVVRVAELNMVDLAGSERQSQTQATGARLKEGANINKSLLTLGNVIAKLSTGERSHVPFRDSKLTRILEPALGGNSRTAIICTITPAAMHSEETISTLKFATRWVLPRLQVTSHEVIGTWHWTC
jgi:centromeric protein E